MARSAFSKVMWVGRATIFMVGLAVVLALLFGVATTALGATGGNFILGQSNVASAVSRLAGNVAGGHALQVSNQSTETGSRALQLGVAEGKAPLAVNATAGTATNLSADELDGKDSSQFLGRRENAADADALGGKAPADYQPRLKWARVLVNGTLNGSRGVVAVNKINTGIYKVEFDENVVHTYSTIGSLNSGSAPGFVMAGAGGPGDPADTVLVTTQNRDFNFVENHFYVTVLC
jgi:hypothetical protein